MFSYKDSKLEADIKQLNSNLNKTEYEKAREPLQRQIVILNKKLYEKDIALQSLYQVCKEFLHNNIKNRQIIVMKNEPHLFYGAVSDIEFEKLEAIKIDLSDYKRVLKENEEFKISNKEIDKECSRLEKKEVELINENENYKDLIYALETYYEITEEDLEKCMKNDR